MCVCARKGILKVMQAAYDVAPLTLLSVVLAVALVIIALAVAAGRVRVGLRTEHTAHFLELGHLEEVLLAASDSAGLSAGVEAHVLALRCTRLAW